MVTEEDLFFVADRLQQYRNGKIDFEQLVLSSISYGRANPLTDQGSEDMREMLLKSCIEFVRGGQYDFRLNEEEIYQAFLKQEQK